MKDTDVLLTLSSLSRYGMAKPGRAVRDEPLDDDLIDASEISRMTGMTIRWVYDTFAIPAKGGIRPIKIGGKSRWYRYEVKAWIAAKRREAELV